LELALEGLVCLVGTLVGLAGVELIAALGNVMEASEPMIEINCLGHI